MAKRRKKEHNKGKKKKGNVFTAILGFLAAIILVPAIALTCLILYAGISGTDVIVPAPLQTLLSRISVSENAVSENAVSDNTATTSGNVLNVAGVSDNQSHSADTQQINLFYHNETTPAKTMQEPIKTTSENTISENAASDNTVSDNVNGEETIF